MYFPIPCPLKSFHTTTDSIKQANGKAGIGVNFKCASTVGSDFELLLSLCEVDDFVSTRHVGRESFDDVNECSRAPVKFTYNYFH